MADNRARSWHMPLGQQHSLLGRQHLLLGPTWPPTSLPLAGRDDVQGDLEVEEVVISDLQFAAYVNLYVVNGGQSNVFVVFTSVQKPSPNFNTCT